MLQRHYTDKKIFYSFYLFNQKKFISKLNKKFKLKEKIFSQNIYSKKSKISFNFTFIFSKMTENFITLFNYNYLPQGLTLYYSLKKITKSKIWVVCIWI